MKKTRKWLAISLAVVQIIAVAVLMYVPIAAADDTAFEVKRTTAAIMVPDAQVTAGEPWDNVEWTENFAMNGNNDKVTDPSVLAEGPGRAKFLWDYTGEAGAATAANLYFYIEYTDPDKVYNQPASNGWKGDCFVVAIDETGTRAEGNVPSSEADQTSGLARRSYSQYTQQSTAPKVDRGWLTWFCNRDESTGKVVLEGNIKIYDAANYAKNDHVLTLAIKIMRNGGGENYSQCQWKGIDPNSQVGSPDFPKIKLKDESAISTGDGVDENADAVFYAVKDYPCASANKNAEGKVTFPTEALGNEVFGWKNMADNKVYAPGATVDLSAATAQNKYIAISADVATRNGAAIKINENANQLRFESVIEGWSDISAYVKEEGFITVETSLLTDAVISKGINEKNLADAGIQFAKSNSANVAEDFKVEVAAKDAETKYSVVSYAKIVFEDGGEKVIYSDYDAQFNSRCVKDVAAAAYNDRMSVKKDDYKYKQGKDWPTAEFEIFSYSPYASSQLAILKKLGGLA